MVSFPPYNESLQNNLFRLPGVIPELFAPYSLATLEMFCLETGLSLAQVRMGKGQTYSLAKKSENQAPLKCIIEFLLLSCGSFVSFRNKVSAR